MNGGGEGNNGIMLKRIARGMGVYYPPSPSNNLVINITGMGVYYIYKV